MQTALKVKQHESCTQFEITSDLLRNLYKFDLTPVTKLVLLELTTHLNESKNGSVVFPSVGYVAEVLGIGLTACKKAINDLIKAGLIIKSKRDNIKGNYNKYLLRLAKFDFKTGKNKNEYKYTQTDINGQKTTNKPSENELFKQSENDLFLYEQKKETKKQQTLSGGNVLGDDEVLRNYAIKHGARNIDAYINTLKKSKSAENIIKEYRKKQNRAVYAFKQTDLLREKRDQEKLERVMPDECMAFVELGKKFGIK